VVYNAVLGLVDIVQGTNSFYKLQLLEADSSKRYSPQHHMYHSLTDDVSRYVLYRAWGRVGTSIGGNKIEVSDLAEDDSQHSC